MTSHPHPVDELTNGNHVTYKVKFEGIYSVGEASGPSPVQSAFIDMKRSKEERIKNGQKKAPIMELQISVKGIVIINLETLAPEVSAGLNKISFIMNDRNNKLYAAFILKTDSDHYECVIVKDDTGKAKEIVMTLAEAFDIAYQRKLEGKEMSPKPSPTPPPQTSMDSDSLTMTNLNKTPSPVLIDTSAANSLELSAQNAIYKERLQKVSELVDPSVLMSFLKENNLEYVTQLKDSKKSSVSENTIYSLLDKQRTASTPSVASARPLHSLSNPFLNPDGDAPHLPEDDEAPQPPPRIALNPPPTNPKSRSNSRATTSVRSDTINSADLFGMECFDINPTKQRTINDPNENLLGNIQSPQFMQSSIDEFDLDIFDPLKSNNRK